MAKEKEDRKKSNETTPAERKVAAPARRGIGVFEDLDRLFDEFLTSRWPAIGWQMPAALRSLGAEGAGGRLPSIDISESDDEIVVRAEVPGVSRENLDVSIVDRTLTIKGRTSEEKKEEREDYYRREIRSGEFSRSVLLPSDVDSGKAKASLKDGVVELHLPKTSGAKRRKIELG